MFQVKDGAMSVLLELVIDPDSFALFRSETCSGPSKLTYSPPTQIATPIGSQQDHVEVLEYTVLLKPFPLKLSDLRSNLGTDKMFSNSVLLCLNSNM
jgi:hypothetical protein